MVRDGDLALLLNVSVVTPQQQEEERVGLSEQEKQLIRQDIYGQLDDTASCASSTAQEVHRHLLNHPDKELTKYYFQALSDAPEVVAIEGPPYNFLVDCNFDAALGALHCAKYWSIRYQVFGPERASNPLQLDETSLLDGDMSVVDRGIVMMLPNDRHGRAVMLFHRNDFNPRNCSTESVMRVALAAIAVSMRQDPRLGQTGIVVLVNMHGFSLTEVRKKEVSGFTCSCDFLLTHISSSSMAAVERPRSLPKLFAIFLFPKEPYISLQDPVGRLPLTFFCPWSSIC